MSRIEPFGTEILNSVSDRLQDSGYELLVFCPTSEHAEGWERRSVARLGGTLVDGCLLVAPTVVDVAADRPVVAIDPHVGAAHLSTVAAQNHEGAVAATSHLIELGHRRIGFLGGRADLESGREREAGYRAALTAAGLPVDPELVQHGDFTEAGAAEPTRRLLSHPERPTSIFAANDRSAMYVLQHARELGLDVPGDLSVVGFDNVPHTLMTSPPLTTVDQSIRALGSEAIRLLLDLIARPDETPHEPVHRLLPVELVIRGSTAPPPSSPHPSR